MTDVAVPPPVNAGVSAIDKLLCAAVFDVAAPLAKAALVADFPFLGFPIISQLFSAGFNALAKYFYTAIDTVGVFAVIDAQADAKKAAYAVAVAAITLAQTNGDANAQQKAIDDYKAALAKLVHFDGAA